MISLYVLQNGYCILRELSTRHEKGGRKDKSHARLPLRACLAIAQVRLIGHKWHLFCRVIMFLSPFFDLESVVWLCRFNDYSRLRQQNNKRDKFWSKLVMVLVDKGDIKKIDKDCKMEQWKVFAKLLKLHKLRHCAWNSAESSCIWFHVVFFTCLFIVLGSLRNLPVWGLLYIMSLYSLLFFSFICHGFNL